MHQIDKRIYKNWDSVRLVDIEQNAMQLDIIKQPGPAADDVEGDELLTAMAICLTDLVSLVNKGSEQPPSSVNLLNFMLRIRRYGKCGDACFLVALVYLDRIVNSSGFVLTPQNVHRVMLTAVMIAAKFHEDHFYNNAFFAKLGELTLWEMNSSEIELLQQLHFSLVVTSDLYNKYHHQLCCYRERARALAKAQEQTPVVTPQVVEAPLIAQPVLMALPLSPGGSVLPGYRHSPPEFTMAQPVQHLQHVPPPPGLTRAIPMHYSGHYQQQPSTGYQVLTMPMPVALPVTPALSYNTPPLMAKLSIYHQQQQQQHQQPQPYY